jgi:hypothetical protein
MNSLTVVSGVRVLVAAFVVAAGLMASAPQVHGTVQSRGAVGCNVNVIATPNCGNKANYMSCEINYTKCKSLSGPKDKICTMNSVSSCKGDTGCMIMTDYTWSNNCTPTGSAPGIASGTTASSAPRPSQVQ